MNRTLLFERAFEKAGTTLGDLSRQLDIKPDTLDRKIKGLSPFYLDEVDQITEIMQLDQNDYHMLFLNE